MKYSHLFITLAFLAPIPSLYAVNLNDSCDIKTFSCYEQHVESICNAKDDPFKDKWWVGPDLWALKSMASCKYPEITKDKLNSAIDCVQSLESSDSTALQDGITKEKFGSANETAFRAVEFARLMYRRNMNSIFSCGVIASRWAKLDSLNSILSGKQGASEIQKSIEKERKRYETLSNQMTCDENRPPNSATGVVERLMKSSMKEYCRYTYYLDYLDANLRENFSSVSNTETQIGNGNTSKPATNTTSAQKELISRGKMIEDERKRANEVLPKAIVAFQEMDRTYVVHVMLTFLYDDYLKLRGQLNTYLTQIGQTFEKAFNAQDDNQR